MKQRILIAEDTEDLRELYAFTLEMEGYEVQSVEDGQSAYEEFLRHPPALLVTDLSLPRMDGFAVIQAIKQEPRFSAIPVILVSAFGNGRLKQLKPLGVNLVLEKPIEPETLLQAVETILHPSPANLD
ncbi:MAG: response regulator [Acidobacteria bacterium]|nr:response regulator [Acidobacteriota bacterium]